MGIEHLDVIGEKVRLRPVRASDAPTDYNLVKNDNVLMYLLWDGPKDIDEITATYTQYESERKTTRNCRLAIESLTNEQLIGMLSIRFKQNPQQADIGYWLGETYWSKGYMTDAVRLACYVAFKYFEAVRVLAGVFVGNIASRRVLEKNGFALDGTMRSENLKRGVWRDEWIFSILKSDWEKNKGYYIPRFEDVKLTPDREE